MTLGADDLLRGRGVRLGSLSGLLDRINIGIRPAQLRRLQLPEPEALLSSPSWPRRSPATRVASSVWLGFVAGDDEEGMDELAAAATVDQLVGAAARPGRAVRAPAWCDIRRGFASRLP